MIFNEELAGGRARVTTEEVRAQRAGFGERLSYGRGVEWLREPCMQDRVTCSQFVRSF